MKTIKHLILATVMALGVVSCKKETSDPRLSDGYFEIEAQSTIEVENFYMNGSGLFILTSGQNERIGYKVSEYMWVRCKTSNCVYYVNNTMYNTSNKFTPPTK